jgi:hypothetical protein
MPLNTLFSAAASGLLVTAGFGILALVLGHRRRPPSWLVRRLKGGAR